MTDLSPQAFLRDSEKITVHFSDMKIEVSAVQSSPGDLESQRNSDHQDALRLVLSQEKPTFEQFVYDLSYLSLLERTKRLRDRERDLGEPEGSREK